MSDEPLPAARARTFVLRVVAAEPDDCHGQAGEPGSADDWQVTFASLDELWVNLRQRLAPRPVTGLSLDGEPTNPKK